MAADYRKTTATSYDTVAADYADRFQHEMSYKPFDRKMLELLVERVGEMGTICDMGCGPGQIAAYLHHLGATACGIDLSAQMVTEAKKLYPDIDFQQGDMLDLHKIADSTFAGIAAFYSLIHIQKPDLPKALSELFRILMPDGRLMLTYHVGEEVRHIDSFFDKPVDLDFIFFETADMLPLLQQAGFIMEEVIERGPYPEESQTRRAYLIARKPAP